MHPPALELRYQYKEDACMDEIKLKDDLMARLARELERPVL